MLKAVQREVDVFGLLEDMVIGFRLCHSLRASQID
jgi:hypothetical protein